MADPAALTMSGLALGVTIGLFAWQHWRKVDRVVCTLVDEKFGRLSGIFTFSLANEGTRPVLFEVLSVVAFPTAEMSGRCCGLSKILTGQPPQTIEAGKMIPVSLESTWTSEFLELAQKEAEKCGATGATLYLEAKAVLWNPKGKRMIASEHVTTAIITGMPAWIVCGRPGEKSFRITTKPSLLQDRKQQAT